MAFARLVAHLRAKAFRTIDALWHQIGHIHDLFEPGFVNSLLTRLHLAGEAQKGKRQLNIWYNGRILVAGTGFEPVTFRL